ncbi:MAG: hypothetical protein LPK07_00940 [Hymenobacteraceae bacterium]|nr:hypothetical protein [Hymenobacteraceae bacterium]
MWRSYVTGLSILFIYLMTTFRFLAPVVHYQLDYTYIANVLCINRDKPALECHGKCQLRKELKQLQTDSQNQDAMQYLVSSFQPVEDVPASAALLPRPAADAAAPLVARYTFSTISVMLPAPFHPPQV